MAIVRVAMLTITAIIKPDSHGFLEIVVGASVCVCLCVHLEGINNQWRDMV